MRRKKKVLAMLLSFVIAFSSLPMGNVSAADITEVVSTQSEIEKSEILSDAESESGEPEVSSDVESESGEPEVSSDVENESGESEASSDAESESGESEVSSDAESESGESEVSSDTENESREQEVSKDAESESKKTEVLEEPMPDSDSSSDNTNDYVYFNEEQFLGEPEIPYWLEDGYTGQLLPMPEVSTYANDYGAYTKKNEYRIPYFSSPFSTFDIGKYLGYCIEHQHKAPSVGATYTVESTNPAWIYNNNSRALKAMYYSFGPGWNNNFDFGGTNYKAAVTMSILSRQCPTGDHVTMKKADEYAAWLDKQTMPNGSLSITNSGLDAFVQEINGVMMQRSQGMELKAGSTSNYITFTVPARCYVYNITTDTRYSAGTSVTIKAGQWFRLEAPLDIGKGTWSSGNLPGHVAYYKTVKVLNFGGNWQRVIIPMPGTDEVSFSVNWLEVEQEGKLQLTKTSANPEITNGNSCYSFAGAEFGVYTSSTATTGQVGTLVTDANGKSNVLSLDAGTYYVKELKAPMGFALSKEIKKVQVTADGTTTVSFADLPQMDPVGVLLGKVDKETNQNKPQGSATLQGAHFEVVYYAGMYTKAEINAGKPQQDKVLSKRWVFETDEDGFCEYNKPYLVSGDELYMSPNGQPSLPIGTITIQEKKAPEGYLLNPEVFVRQITTEGNAEWVNTYNQPIIPENILKLDLVKKQVGTNIVIPGARFEHTKPDGTKEVLTTNAQGKLTFKGLQHGAHQLKEISAPDGYQVNGNIIKFTVAENNKITLTSSIDNSKGQVTFEVTKEGNISIEMEDKLAPFSLMVHKTNNKNVKLSGAEFTLYTDKACTKVFKTGVTGTAGTLKLDGLVVGTKYYLKETKAPAGYRLPVDANGNPIVYEVYAESTPAKDQFIFYVNGKAYTSASDPNGMFTVTGTKAARIGNVKITNEAEISLVLTKKQEGTEVVIPGATFEHTRPDGTKKAFTTNANGKITIKGLQPGTHTLKETSAPDGYLVNGNVITFTVGKDYSINLTSVIDKNKGNVTFTVTNGNEINIGMEDKLAPFSLMVHKTNNKNVKLSGAEFTLYTDKACTQVFKKGVTDTNGLLKLNGLTVGTKYYLKETKAPAGYRLPVDANGNPIVYEVYAESTPAKDQFIFYVNGKAYTSASDPNGMFTVTGTKADQIGNMKIVNEAEIRLVLTKKQEGTNIIIPGATFEYTGPDGTKKTFTTNENGKFTIKGLQPGTHTLKEISVMDGYEVNGNVITFTVEKDYSIKLTSVIDKNKGNVTFTVTNGNEINIGVEDKLSPFSLLIHKINDKNMKLEGAEFTLYTDKACTQVFKTGVTGADGLLKIDGLTVGTKYYLKETKAPEGYRVSTDLFGNPIVYEIYTESIPAEDKFLFYVDGQAYDSNSQGNFTVTGTKADREASMTIENKIGRRLPETGSNMMPPLMLSGCILVMIAFMFNKNNMCLKRRKKMRKNNLMKMFALALAATIATSAFPGATAFAAGSAVEQQEARGAVAFTSGGVADFGRGTAKIVIKGNEGQTLKGKEFNVYQLFNAENATGMESINYTFNPEYQEALKTVVGRKLGKPASEVTEYAVIDYIQTLNTNPVEGADAEQKLEGRYSKFRYFIEELRNEMVKQGMQSDIVRVTNTKPDNSIEIAGLPYGYYIVDEVTNVSDSHSAASLCMVNTANPEADVTIKSDYPSVIKKIEEDDGNYGWNDMADFEIGQTVPYKFVSNVPNMNGYDTYYYAWHDIMDEELTFKPESVNVTINEKTSGKSYTLTKSEFTVNTNPGNGETFVVAIKDLKAIVDREFDRMNSLNENVYGQEVVLRYDAVLNDKAADDTGRPGFENDVKLEFSNDPDGNGNGQTGETPWDTVVCFTYKLNGLKTNNHDLKLEGAKFRLYSDEACKNEVYVKKTDKGYNVINRDSVGGNDHTGGTIPADAVEMVSNKDGIFTIFGLDGGTYWLKETEAPTGYRPILDPIKLEVIPTFVENRDVYVKGQGATDQALKTLEYEVEIKQFIAGILEEDTFALETDIEDGSGNLTVINHVGKKLPITGSSMTYVYLGAGLLLIILAVAKKKNKKIEEK